MQIWNFNPPPAQQEGIFLEKHADKMNECFGYCVFH